MKVWDERFCTCWNENWQGDENHVLCKNSSTVDNQRKYLPGYFANHPSTLKLIQLLQTDKPKIVCKLDAFLSNVLPLFQQLGLCWKSVVYHCTMVLFYVHIPYHYVWFGERKDLVLNLYLEVGGDRCGAI